jgi:DNA ligase 1
MFCQPNLFADSQRICSILPQYISAIYPLYPPTQTHAHSDHYTGLSERWSAGPVYCSQITANFAHKILGVPLSFLRPLPLDTPTSIEGVEVTLVDANHCPGAVQVLFRTPDGHKYVHTGDMRYCADMQSHPHLKRMIGCDGLYLDTTYAKEKHTFPEQKESIDYVVRTVRAALREDGLVPGGGPGEEGESAGAGAGVRGGGEDEDEDEEEQGDGEAAQQQRDDISIDTVNEGGDGGRREDSQRTVDEGAEEAAAAVETPPTAPRDRGPGEPSTTGGSAGGDALAAAAAAAVDSSSDPARGRYKTLVVISTYVIGKERILSALHRSLGYKMYVNDAKLDRVGALGIPELEGIFTGDPAATPFHVVSWGFCGETWPYFKPNFVNLEARRAEYGADRVLAFVPTGWTFEMKKKGFPVREKGAVAIHLVP